MGSAEVSNANPHLAMAETEKRSLKKLLKVLFKKDKKKEKHEEVLAEEPPKTVPTSAQAVECILEKIKNLDLKKEHEEDRDSDNDELKNFSFKNIKCDEVKAERSDSHSSQDSGFIEKFIQESLEDDKDDDVLDKDDDVLDKDGDVLENDDDVLDSFKNLNLEDGKKEKKVHTVVIARGPIRNKNDLSKQTGPYHLQQTDTCRSIQINKHTLTGGQVIVNQRQPDTELLQFDNALKQVQQTTEHLQHEQGRDWLIDAISELYEDSKTSHDTNYDTNVISEFLSTEELHNDTVILTPPHQPVEVSPNPVEEFANHMQYFNDVSDFALLSDIAEIPAENQNQYFLTPPHSVNAYSPMSDSNSYKTSEYTYSPERSSTLSPERSSPICNGDYEKFQEIAPYEDQHLPEKKTDRKDSSSSMTLKQYKDLQKDINQTFSEKDCCILTRKTCKQIFQEYLQKLSLGERKNICFKVAKMDLKTAYGALQNILMSLSHSSEMEELQYALFRLVCERVLAEHPDWLVDDFGLNLLKSAALRCPHRPVLTRYLVQCVRSAIRHDSSSVQGRESVFHEVDAFGDTLLIACVRRGDACGDVLAELTRRDATELPLFRVNHVNADGASALHVAASEHGAASPRLHCAHVLLQHAGADVWQRDAKGGDTALHMAVNSRTCHLHMIMVIFSHLNRKEWKKLAHAPNTCSKSPLENARSAMKSPSRENYPAEVVEFLKKCR